MNIDCTRVRTRTRACDTTKVVIPSDEELYKTKGPIQA